MAQEYCSIEDAARISGISIEELTRLAQKREIRAFSDGGKWKFRPDDIEAFSKKRQFEEGSSDMQVMLDEGALAAAGGGADDAIPIAGDFAKAPSDSDVKLVSDDSLKVELPAAEGTEFDLTGLDSSGDVKADASASDSDLTRALDKINLEGESDIGLGASPSDSDVTAGADSGINLANPADSGISLEKVESESESDSEFELSLSGDDSDLFSSSMKVPAFKDEEDDEGFKKPPSVRAKAKSQQPAKAEPTSDSDFELAVDDDEYATEEESGSEVVAIEEGEEHDEAEDDFVSGVEEEGDEYADEMPVGGAAIPRGGLVAASPPWPAWMVIPCALTTLVMAMVGMMLYETMRFAWSTNTDFVLSATLIKWFAGVFGKS